MATPETPQHASKASNGEAFRRWRRGRPFWGGLLMVKSGVALFLSANLEIGHIKLHLGPQGFLSYLIPALMLLCGVLVWVTPQVRLFYGIIGLIVATYSLVGLNLGGFAVGLLLGIIGGALVVAWTPDGRVKRAEPAPTLGPPDGAADDTVTMDGLLDKRPDDTDGGRTQPIAVEYQIPAARPGLRPGAGSPGEGTVPEEDPGNPGSGRHRTQLFVVALLAGALTAALLTAGSPPTRAQAAPSPTECPPSAAAALRKAGRPQAPKAQKSPRSTRTAAKPKAPRAEDDPSDRATSAPSVSPTPSGSSNPIADGWNDFVEDVEDFFNGDATPTPTPSATPTATPSPSGNQPSQPKPGDPTTPPAPGDPQPEPSATTTAVPPVPCLGERQFITAEPDGEPVVAERPAILKTDSLAMYGPKYEGVVELRTADGGKIKVLKFTMNKAVNKPFQLRVPERDGGTTVIDSSELTTEGNVNFYTPKFVGTLVLLGIPLFKMEFTPEHPPPLMLPELHFKDATIELSFVRCDKLTADALKIGLA